MRVRIYRPAKSALQSRCSCGGAWCVEPLLDTPRSVNPVTGHPMADDALSCLFGRLTFATSGEALTFVRARGWAFQFDRVQERKVVPKSYIDNFNPDRRRSGR